MQKIYNFSPGPAKLPEPVIKRVKEEFEDFNGHGYSIVEHSHRAKDFVEIIDLTKKKLLGLLGLDQGYEVLFLQGGATTEFFRVAYNLLAAGKTADYIETGVWVKKAVKEASNVGEVEVIASSKDKNFSYIPKAYDFRAESEYVYLCSNNTVVGTQYQTYPKPPAGKFLVGDFTSDILCRECDLSDFGIIFAGAQKNLGPAGLSVVVIRNDILQRCRADIPGINSYQTMVKENSLYNTSPVFPIYFTKLVLEWLEAEGGVAGIEKINREKARLVYEMVDNHPLYIPTANEEDRSIMNFTFKFVDDSMTDKFVAEAKKVGLVNLKGHRSVGGIRVSSYNAMPLAGIERLVEFMEEFAGKFS